GGISLPSATAATTSATLRGHVARRGRGLHRWTDRQSDADYALLRLLSERQTGTAREDEVLAIGHPERGRVEIDAGRHVLHGASGNVVDDDEAVIGTGADERDLLAIGRPLRVALHAPLNDEWLFAAIDFGSRLSRRDFGTEDLAVLDEENAAAVGRELGAGAIGDAPCASDAAGACGPEGVLGTVGIGSGVGRPAVAIGTLTAQEDDGAAIVRDFDLRHHDAVVLHEVGDAHRREERRGGGVGVALAFGVIDPRDAVGLARGDDLLR